MHTLHSILKPNLARTWANPLHRAATRWSIPPHLPQQHWLAQILHETAGLTRLEESLAYTPQRLTAVWPHRFPTLERAKAVAAQGPRGIAESVYGGRLGNGPTGTGDGWRYRGRGLIQLTGRANYAAYAAASGVDAERHPELLLDPYVAADAAGWYWHHRGLNARAEADDLEAVTRGVNGGLNGLADRREWLERLRDAPTLTNEPAAGPERLGTFERLVLHDLTNDDVLVILAAHLDHRPAILERTTVSVTPTVGGSKLDARREPA